MSLNFNDEFRKFRFTGSNKDDFVLIATRILTAVPLEDFPAEFKALNNWLRRTAVSQMLELKFATYQYSSFGRFARNPANDGSVMLDEAVQASLGHYFKAGLTQIQNEFPVLVDTDAMLTQVDLRVVDLMTRLLEMRGKENVKKMATHLSVFLQQEIQENNSALQWLSEVSRPIRKNYVADLVKLGEVKLDQKYHPEKYAFPIEGNALLEKFTSLRNDALSLTDKLYYTSLVDLCSAGANANNTTSKTTTLLTVTSVLGTSIWAATYFTGPVAISLALGIGTDVAGKALIWTNFPGLTSLGKALQETSRQIFNVIAAISNLVFSANYRLHSLLSGMAKLPLTLFSTARYRVNIPGERSLRGFSTPSLLLIAFPLRAYTNHALRDQTALALRNGGNKVLLFMQCLERFLEIDREDKLTLPEKLAQLKTDIDNLSKNPVFAIGEKGRLAIEQSLKFTEHCLKNISEPNEMAIVETISQIQEAVEDYNQYVNNQTGASFVTRQGHKNLASIETYLATIDAIMMDENQEAKEKYVAIRAKTNNLMQILKPRDPKSQSEAYKTCLRIDSLVRSLRTVLGVEESAGLSSLTAVYF